MREAERIGLVNEVVPRGQGARARAGARARDRRAARRARSAPTRRACCSGVGRTLEERLRIEAELTMSMFMRRDSHTIGAGAFKRGERAGVAAPRPVEGETERHRPRCLRGSGAEREPLARQEGRHLVGPLRHDREGEVGSGPPLDQRPQVTEGEHHPHGRGDLEVGGVRARPTRSRGPRSARRRGRACREGRERLF